jgi:HlyD family secretion protein
MKKVLKISGLVLLGLLVIWTFIFLYKKSRPKVKTYQIETVTKNNIEKRTVATGKVQPRNEILIKPNVGHYLGDLQGGGEQVVAGDIIAKIQVIPDMVT